MNLSYLQSSWSLPTPPPHPCPLNMDIMMYENPEKNMIIFNYEASAMEYIIVRYIMQMTLRSWIIVKSNHSIFGLL